jgi:hypothetical protein
MEQDRHRIRKERRVSMSLTSSLWLRILISVSALALALVHFFNPSFLSGNLIILGLIGLAVLPWLAPIVQSIELPGGAKITLRDVKEAGQQIAAGNSGAVSESILSHPLFPQLAQEFPEVGLRALTLEMEARLRSLAEVYSLPDRESTTRILDGLQEKGFDSEKISGLREFMRVGAQASNRSQVEQSVSQWVLTKGRDVLDALAVGEAIVLTDWHGSGSDEDPRVGAVQVDHAPMKYIDMTGAPAWAAGECPYYGLIVRVEAEREKLEAIRLDKRHIVLLSDVDDPGDIVDVNWLQAVSQWLLARGIPESELNALIGVLQGRTRAEAIATLISVLQRSSPYAINIRGSR